MTGRASIHPQMATTPVYVVLAPAGHTGMWMQFRITTDLQHAAETAQNIGGCVARMDIVTVHIDSGPPS